jgi:RNA-directed DNA polymerase
LDAVSQVHRLINSGHVEIVDADLTAYFDTLPHAELLKSVARRVVDRAMLHLIKMWLRLRLRKRMSEGRNIAVRVIGMRAGDRLRVLLSALC